MILELVATRKPINLNIQFKIQNKLLILLKVSTIFIDSLDKFITHFSLFLYIYINIDIYIYIHFFLSFYNIQE